VVGGGPTGVEFSGELSDFIMKDVRQRYAHVKDDIHVTLIEVCFYSFDSSLGVFITLGIVFEVSNFYRPGIFFHPSMIVSDVMLSSS